MESPHRTVAFKPQVGVASWFGKEEKRTANGEHVDLNSMSAAHKTLPFGTKVRVTRLDNGRSVIVRINDRGPFKRGRIIDLTKGAARELDILNEGTTRCRIEVVDEPG